MSALPNPSRFPGMGDLPGDSTNPNSPHYVEIDTQPIEDALHDSVPFVSEAWQELDWDALAKAWQDRDAMEALRLMDNAYETYKRFHIERALGQPQPRDALRHLVRVYGEAA